MNKTADHLDEVSKFTTLFMKDNNTDDNAAIKKTFIGYAWEQSNGNYFQALKRLLENSSVDYKYASLFDKIEDLKCSIIEVQEAFKKPEEKKTEVPRFFGGDE